MRVIAKIVKVKEKYGIAYLWWGEIGWVPSYDVIYDYSDGFAIKNIEVKHLVIISDYSDLSAALYLNEEVLKQYELIKSLQIYNRRLVAMNEGGKL